MSVDFATNVADGDELAEGQQLGQVDQILEAAGVRDRVFYEESGNGRWWYQSAKDGWVGRNTKLFESYLKSKGVNGAREDNETQSDLERAVLHVATNLVVQYAGPVAGMQKGVQMNNGQRVLVTRSPEIPPLTPGEFSTITALVDQMFGPQEDGGPDQRPYILGWWKHSLECLINNYDNNSGLAMVLAGEAGCGKSLLKALIRISLGGRECKPYRFMIGQENFNGEFIGAELWAIDDEQSMTDPKSRSEFGANIKKTVADDLYRIRGMMRDGVILKMFKRLLICVNREPERLMVLPQLDDDIADKISILLAHKHPMPMAVASPEDKRLFWSTLMEELPHFLHWLVHEYVIDPQLFARFGVKEYHHPDLCGDLFEMSRERVLWEQINKTLFDDVSDLLWNRKLSASDLRALLTSDDAPLTTREKNSLPSPNWFGKCLSKIAKQYPERIQQRKSHGKRVWWIVAEGRTVLEAQEISALNDSFGGQHGQ